MNYGLQQVCMTQNTPGYLGIRLSHRTAENSTLRKLLALKTMGDTCATTRKKKKGSTSQNYVTQESFVTT